MAQAEYSTADEQEANRKLEASLNQLHARAQERLQEEYGLSDKFAESVGSTADAMALCERAMEKLAMEYVRNLEVFREQTDPLEALRYLEESEVIWRAEAKVISALDRDGEQGAFLEEMRQLGSRVMEEKLHEAATACSRGATPERVALCIGILAVIDEIWGEMGVPVDHPERQNIRKTVFGFKD